MYLQGFGFEFSGFQYESFSKTAATCPSHRNKLIGLTTPTSQLHRCSKRLSHLEAILLNQCLISTYTGIVRSTPSDWAKLRRFHNKSADQAFQKFHSACSVLLLWQAHTGTDWKRTRPLNLNVVACKTHTQTHSHGDANRQTARQGGRRTGHIHIERHRYTETDKHTPTQTNKQTNKHFVKHTNTQTNRDTRTHRQTHTRAHTRAHTHTHAHTHTPHTHTQTHTHTHARTHTYTHTHTRARARACTLNMTNLAGNTIITYHHVCVSIVLMSFT